MIQKLLAAIKLAALSLPTDAGPLHCQQVTGPSVLPMSLPSEASVLHRADESPNTTPRSCTGEQSTSHQHQWNADNVPLGGVQRANNLNSVENHGEVHRDSQDGKRFCDECLCCKHQAWRLNTEGGTYVGKGVQARKFIGHDEYIYHINISNKFYISNDTLLGTLIFLLASNLLLLGMLVLGIHIR